MWFGALSLIKNWKVIGTLLLVFGVLGAFASAGILYYQKKALEVELESANTALETTKATLLVCQNDKKISYEVSNDYQNKLSSLRRAYNANRVPDSRARCIPVTR